MNYLETLDLVLQVLTKSVKTDSNTKYTGGSISQYFESKGIKFTAKELEAILFKLRADGYIIINRRDSNAEVIYFIGRDTELNVTWSGIIFNSNGGYVKQQRIKKITEFPRNYWWLLAIFAWVFGIAATIVATPIGKWIEKRLNTSQQQQAIPASVDSGQNRKTVHDTIYVDSPKTKK